MSAIIDWHLWSLHLHLHASIEMYKHPRPIDCGGHAAMTARPNSFQDGPFSRPPRRAGCELRQGFVRLLFFGKGRLQQLHGLFEASSAAQVFSVP
jgi:hypothetical protein